MLHQLRYILGGKQCCGAVRKDLGDWGMDSRQNHTPMLWCSLATSHNLRTCMAWARCHFASVGREEGTTWSAPLLQTGTGVGKQW